MSRDLEQWKGQIVSILTADGKNYVGVLGTVDFSLNIAIQHSHERIYSPDSPVKQVPCGDLVIRGENLLALGPIDEDKDLAIDFDTIRGKPIPHLQH